MVKYARVSFYPRISRGAVWHWLPWVRPAAEPAPQTLQPSSFTIYIRGAPVGSEQVSVEHTADGWTITSGGPYRRAIDLIIRGFKARYDAGIGNRSICPSTPRSRPALDAAGLPSRRRLRHRTDGRAWGEPLRRTDTIDPQSIFLPNPFIAPYEAVAARGP